MREETGLDMIKNRSSKSIEIQQKIIITKPLFANTMKVGTI